MADLVDEADLIIAQRVEVRIMAIRQQLHGPEQEIKDCEACGQPIGDARRHVMPGAMLCVYCQSFAEQRRKHFLR